MMMKLTRVDTMFYKYLRIYGPTPPPLPPVGLHGIGRDSFTFTCVTRHLTGIHN
jgi:hypothetical protein